MVFARANAKTTNARRRHRWQGLHPVTGARWSLSAKTSGDLHELVARARRIGHELRSGQLSRDAAMLQCESLAGGKIHLPRLWTVRDAWLAYAETVFTISTRQKLPSLWKILEPDVGDELISSITDGKLESLCAKWRRAGYSSSYVAKGLWSFLAAAIRHAKALKKIDQLPWENFSPPKVISKKPPAHRSLDELRAMLAIAHEDDRLDDARGKLGDMSERVTTLALAGLRNGEGAGLGWDRVDFQHNTLRIDVQAIDQWQKHAPEMTRPLFPTKNATSGKSLVQTMHPDVRAALLRQRARLKRRGWYREDGPVFPTVVWVTSRGDESARVRVYEAQWRKNANCIYPEDARSLAVRAGVPNAHRWVTHSWRHSMVTLELVHGAAPRALQGRTGHSSMRQLEMYAAELGGAPSAIPRLEETEGTS